VRSNVELEAMKDNQKSSAYHTTSGDIARKTKEQDKILLTLLMEAVKADRKQQAFDIVRMLHNTVSMNAASQIAELYSSFALKERILLYKSDFEAKHRAREKAVRNEASLRYVTDTYDEPYSNGKDSESKTSFEPRKGVSRRTAAATVTKPASRYESPLPIANLPSYADLDSTLDSSAINASPSRKRKIDDDHLAFDEPSVDRTSLKKAHQDETAIELAPPAKAGKLPYDSTFSGC
jgi:chromosome transmission fidelity protein 4